MAVKCTICGGSHPKWDCTRPQTKSTAVRTDVQRHASSIQMDAPPRPDEKKSVVRGEAGTQALPVDNHSKANFDRNKYQREYMQDRATIKRLGLEMTVKQYRESSK